jgi:hypothetical protein
MNRILFLIGIFIVLLMAGPASAALVLDFGTGDAGAVGTITDTGATTGSGVGIGIDVLTVFGAGAADGTYDVDGTVTGAGEAGVGSLDYNTTGNVLTVTGSISCQAGSGACTAAQIAAGTTIVANTTLLLGTGTLSISQTGGTLDSVTINPLNDDKAASLLAALGIACSPDAANPGFCAGWQTGQGFTIGAQIGSGNTYTAFSTDVPNSFVPEPASILLLGTVLLVVTGLLRRRLRKA